jgi:RNA polymerase sigma factor (sigma-70 family)
MEWLNIVAKHHKEYIKIVKSWGEDEYSEDIVQEMYIKLWERVEPSRIIKDGQVNKYFVFVTLRRMVVDLQRQRSRVDKVRIGEGFEIGEDFDLIDETEPQKHQAFLRLHELIENEKENWHWYDKMLFELYAKTDMSLRDIEKEVKISYTSAGNTIKRCKHKLKESVGEDYEDFINGDYERI